MNIHCIFSDTDFMILQKKELKHGDEFHVVYKKGEEEKSEFIFYD